MKKTAIFTFLLMVLPLTNTPIYAGEIAKEGSLLILGITSGFAFHELGHQAVAEVKGIDMKWKLNGNWDSDRKDQVVSLAGFGAQILSTEVMLNTNINKKNSYVFGWLAYNVIGAIQYTIANEIARTRGQKHNDFQNIKTDRFVEAVIVSHALFTAYRVYKNKDYPVWIGVSRDKVIVGLKKVF